MEDTWQHIHKDVLRVAVTQHACAKSRQQKLIVAWNFKIMGLRLQHQHNVFLPPRKIWHFPTTNYSGLIPGVANTPKNSTAFAPLKHVDTNGAILAEVFLNGGVCIRVSNHLVCSLCLHDYQLLMCSLRESVHSFSMEDGSYVEGYFSLARQCRLQGWMIIARHITFSQTSAQCP